MYHEYPVFQELVGELKGFFVGDSKIKVYNVYLL
jgi:hypothetical protein